eukprot:2690614-Pyramimonas_sp.AAC.1
MVVNILSSPSASCPEPRGRRHDPAGGQALGEVDSLRDDASPLTSGHQGFLHCPLEVPVPLSLEYQYNP